MSTQSHPKPLHLPSLSVKGFRGISDLSITRLGRVTLIAGMNGVGKTTLLEAVRVYAARGSYSVLSSILGNREELTSILDEDGDELSVPDLEALVYGRHPSEDTSISIGALEDGHNLNIRFGPGLRQYRMPLSDDFADVDDPLFSVEFQGVKEGIFAPHRSRSFRFRGVAGRPRRRISEPMLPEPIQCEAVGPSVMDNDSMARFWDSVALTDYETQAVQALQLIYGDEVDRVAMVGDEERRLPQRFTRRAVVRIKGQERPVPLKSLGDGAVRIFSSALAIANSRDGFFVIDEAENGIHHSVQATFWKMILTTALENDVQVLATTHSWDCVVGFARATELVGADGLLVRIDRLGERMRAIEYSENDLQVVARQGIEVR